ncbi:hypothetical protein BD414DRAFT_238149 [Trametes punicea]|nr:hypothetical protein BD414DRAFT_238149 [Trametes punicea]
MGRALYKGFDPDFGCDPPTTELNPSLKTPRSHKPGVYEVLPLVQRIAIHVRPQQLDIMPRDNFTLAALNAILERLPHWHTETAALFMTNTDMNNCRKKVTFDEVGEAIFEKAGYTKSKSYGNIYYQIHITKTGDPTGQRFKIYVMKPSSAPDANRAAVASAINYFLGTESTINSVDIEATHLV